MQPTFSNSGSGCNVNAIRDVTQTHIDIEKPKKGGGDRTITIRGNNESTTLAYTLMEELINHPEKEIEDIIDHHLPNEGKARKEKPDQELCCLFQSYHSKNPPVCARTEP